MGCSVSKYLKEVEKLVKDKAPDVPNVGQQVLRNIKRSGSAEANKQVKAYLTEKLGGGYNKVYNLPSGNQGYPGFIKSVSITDSGNLDLQIQDLSKKGTVRTYNEVNIASGQAKGGQRVAMVKGLENRLFIASEVSPSGIADVTRVASGVSIQANRYVSHMLIGYAEEGSGLIAPYVKKWHTQVRRKSKVYKETTNMITKGFASIEMLDKIKASLHFTGDFNKRDLANVTTLADESARRNYELLQNEMPALDAKIKNLVKDKSKRELMDDMFGKAGFGNLFDVPGLVNRLESGEDVQVIIDSMGMHSSDIAVAENLASYYVDRDYKGFHNSNGNKEIGALAVLIAMKKNDSAGAKLITDLANNDSTKDLYLELKHMTSSIKELTEIINENKQGSSFGQGSGVFYTDYDGNNAMDVYDKLHEFQVVSIGDVNTGKFEGTPWKMLRAPKEGTYGIMYRESGSSYMEGLGVNSNRVTNGIPLDRDVVLDIEKRTKKPLHEQKTYMQANNIVHTNDSGTDRYRVVLSRKEFDEAHGKKNLAHTLFRTYTHNKGLIETNTVRSLIKDTMTINGSEGVLNTLNNRIRSNRKKKAVDREEVKIFIKSEITPEELKARYPEVAKKYKKVDNISNYGNFDKEIQYVRRDMADVVTGHSQHLITSDEYPNVQMWEQKYKELVQLLKLKLVVANPAKLGVDMLSNAGILMSMDVGVIDMYKNSKEGFELATNMSTLEGSLVSAKFDLSLAEAEKNTAKITMHTNRVAKIQSQIENDPYYDAVKYGFIQSMGTSMMIKEFDTISGLQNTMDELIGKLVKDHKGRPNDAHRAIKWWMEAGFGVNDVLDAVSNISKVKGTGFEEELVGISKRLKDKKTEEDTVRYIGEFLASPASEVVRQGSRAMQMGDVMARWTLYIHEIKRELDLQGIKYNDTQGAKVFFASINKASNSEIVNEAKDKAGEIALETFIDYRLNMPSEIKGLSDYGILMFPSFWMRAQRIIFNLAKYHPLNAGGGYLAADLLDMGGASILDANVVSKLVNGHLVHAGQDVLDPKTFILGF